jgi:hypothetical protein
MEMEYLHETVRRQYSCMEPEVRRSKFVSNSDHLDLFNILFYEPSISYNS